jgi:deoxyribonuclease V
MNDGLQNRWDVSVEEAKAIQDRLRPRVSTETALPIDQIRTIAGVDAIYGDDAKAAVVLLAFPSLEVIDRAVAVRRNTFPYVPGLLAFREIPAVLLALDRLNQQPDVLMTDGHGYAHPRRFGLASHLGVYLDRPCVGCAKTRLIGSFNEPGPAVGDRSSLVQKGETIGMVVRTKRNVAPIFVSIGHKFDLATAVELVLRCGRGYRLPEPTRLADQLSRAPTAPSLFP